MYEQEEFRNHISKPILKVTLISALLMKCVDGSFLNQQKTTLRSNVEINYNGYIRNTRMSITYVYHSVSTENIYGKHIYKGDLDNNSSSCKSQC